MKIINLIPFLSIAGLYFAILDMNIEFLNYVHVMSGVILVGLVVFPYLFKVDYKEMRDTVMPLTLAFMFITFGSGAIMYNQQGRPTFLNLLHTSLPAQLTFIIDSIDVNTFLLSVTLIILSILYIKGYRGILISLGHAISSLSLVFMIFIMGMLVI
jgi:hypothetical protein